MRKMTFFYLHSNNKKSLEQKMLPALNHYYERAEQLESPFLQAFYKHMLTSIAVDVEEFFLHTPAQFNYFAENLHYFQGNKIKSFFKWICAYNTVVFLYKNKASADFACTESLFFIFAFNEEEQAVFWRLHATYGKDESQCLLLFSKMVMRIFRVVWDNPFSLAFVGNFFYNSYDRFMRSLTKYTTFSALINRG